MNSLMTEDFRRKATAVVAWGSWAIAIGLTAYLTYYNVNRPPTALPTALQRVGGLIVIVLMGTGIAAGTALSRMKLGETINRVFEEGYKYGGRK